MMNRAEVFKILAEFRTDEIVVSTMGATRWWAHLSPSPLNFQCTGAMGYAPSVGLGLALGCPEKRVVVLNGDGSLLMNLGTLVTIANQSPSNLIHFVLENGLYELPGKVPIPGVDKISLCGFARAAGLTKVYEFDDLRDLREHITAIMHEPGPIFVDLKVAPGSSPRLMSSEFDMAREIEKALEPSGVADREQR